MNRKLLVASLASVVLFQQESCASIFAEGVQYIPNTSNEGGVANIPGEVWGRQTEIDASEPWCLYDVPAKKDGVSAKKDGVPETKIWYLKFQETNGVKVKIIGDVLPKFDRMTSLMILNLSNLDMPNVTKMNYVFCGCKNLIIVRLSNLNIQNVTDMSCMFKNCDRLKKVILSDLNTQNVTNMDSMFYGCRSLKTLNLSNLNTQNVTNMREMFAECKGLLTLDLSTLNTQHVTDMYSMFYRCEGLLTLNLSHLDTQNVTNMSEMFRDCRNLSKIDISHFDMRTVDDIEEMFHGCRSLFEMQLNEEVRQRINSRPEITTTYIFKGCQSLSSLPDIFSKNKFGKANGDADGCINTLNR